MDTPLTISPAAVCALSILSAASVAPQAGCSRPADAAGSERTQVAAIVQRYFQGHATGDGEHHRQAFHPHAKVYSVRGGKLAALTRDEFAALFPGTPAADEARRVRRILSVDIAGDVAVAKVELDYPEDRFVDYLSLLKIDGSWVIINKVFHRQGRKPARARAAPAAPGR